jgi:RNA polymerase sigma-70 factor (ECF subfamily)
MSQISGATGTARPDAGRLIQGHAEGDESAFPALVTAYRKPVYSYLGRCGVEHADRDDVFQAVFLRIHRAASQYEPDRPCHPWIFTIVANEVRSHLKRRRIRQLISAATPPAHHPEADPRDPAPDGERIAVARQTVERLEREIRGLPLPQREVLVLACVESLPLKDVAETLGLPLNTVKTHLRRARLALGEKLRRSAVGEELS